MKGMKDPKYLELVDFCACRSRSDKKKKSGHHEIEMLLYYKFDKYLE